MARQGAPGGKTGSELPGKTGSERLDGDHAGQVVTDDLGLVSDPDGEGAVEGGLVEDFDAGARSEADESDAGVGSAKG